MPVSPVLTGSTDAAIKVQEWIRTHWVNAGLGRTYVQYGNNLDFIAPDGTTTTRRPPDNDYWMRVNLKSGRATTATFGAGGLNLTQGVVILQLFGPKGVGEGPLKTLAGFAKAMMNRQDIDDLVFLAANDGGVTDDIREGFVQCNVECPFYFYETS